MVWLEVWKLPSECGKSRGMGRGLCLGLGLGLGPELGFDLDPGGAVLGMLIHKWKAEGKREYELDADRERVRGWGKFERRERQVQRETNRDRDTNKMNLVPLTVSLVCLTTDMACSGWDV
eukprot:1328990-Amorphochlora_amoeboformis.AAC.2